MVCSILQICSHISAEFTHLLPISLILRSANEFNDCSRSKYSISVSRINVYISNPHHEGLPSDRLIHGQDFSFIESQNRLMIVLVLEIASLSLKLLYLEQYCAKTLYGYLSCMGIFCI